MLKQKDGSQSKIRLSGNILYASVLKKQKKQSFNFLSVIRVQIMLKIQENELLN